MFIPSSWFIPSLPHFLWLYLKWKNSGGRQEAKEIYRGGNWGSEGWSSSIPRALTIATSPNPTSADPLDTSDSGGGEHRRMLVPGCFALPATVLAISPLPRSFIFLKDLNFLSFFFWLCRLFVSMHIFPLVAANWGCSLVAVCEFLIAEVSLVAEHRL